MKQIEHAHAKAFFGLVRLHEVRYPELKLLFAVPNGGSRRKAVAGKLRAEGVRAGVADYIALVPRQGFHSLAIELKKPKQGRVTDAQSEFLTAAAQHNCRAEVARGWEEAWAITCDYFGIAPITSTPVPRKTRGIV